MSSRTSVDTTSVRSAGNGFDLASIDAVAVLTDAVERLSKFNGVWGTDETGREFEKVYAPPRDGLIKGLEAIPQLLKNYSGGLGSTADIYERADGLAGDIVLDAGSNFNGKK